MVCSHTRCKAANTFLRQVQYHAIKHRENVEIIPNSQNIRYICKGLAVFYIEICAYPAFYTFQQTYKTGAVLEATESRKHQANDEKCTALGWVSTPPPVDSYGAWGKEASFFCTSCNSACNPQVPAKVTGFFRPVLQLKYLLN